MNKVDYYNAACRYHDMGYAPSELAHDPKFWVAVSKEGKRRMARAKEQKQHLLSTGALR